VVICGRRESALKEAADRFPSLTTRVCDLSEMNDREALYNWIQAEHGDLNVLVNNAGIQNWMTIDDPDFFTWAEIEIAINIEAPVHLTSLFQNLKSLTIIGFSEQMTQASPVGLNQAFARMNESN